MKDVARHASVSPATVSRVIRNVGIVAPKTRERTFEAIKKLNYYVNENARSMIHGRTKTIGVIIFDISNPFFPLWCEESMMSLPSFCSE